MKNYFDEFEQRIHNGQKFNNANCMHLEKAQILTQISEHIDEFETQILDYLKNGLFIIDCPTTFIDKVNPTISIPEHNKYTDWNWVWDNATIYYIEKYHYHIDSKFREHILKKLKERGEL
jgi:hypothetical protein